MKRAHLELSYLRLAQELGQPLSHLIRSFVRESDRANCGGWYMAVENEVGDPRGKNLYRVNVLVRVDPTTQRTLVFPLPGPARICSVELGGWVAATHHSVGAQTENRQRTHP
jgi:hypothetical protein